MLNPRHGATPTKPVWAKIELSDRTTTTTAIQKSLEQL